MCAVNLQIQWTHSQFNELVRTGWVSLSPPAAVLLVINVGDVSVLTLKTSVIRYIMHSLSHSELCPCSYLCQPHKKPALTSFLDGSHSHGGFDFSSSSSTQIISRKNPEDVQEVRHVASIFIFWVCVCAKQTVDFLERQEFHGLFWKEFSLQGWKISTAM